MDFLSNYSINIDTKKRVVVFQELPPNPEARASDHAVPQHWR